MKSSPIPTNCIICDAKALTQAFVHTYWNKPVYVCDNCGHAHLYDYKYNVDNRDYSTNQHRSIKYFQQMKNIPVDSILEIGPTHDFFLLNQFHRTNEQAKLFYYDTAELKPPSWIKKNNDTNKKFDMVIALHVMEHVQHTGFAKYVADTGKYFVIEVPNCDKWEHKVRTTNQGHYHGYTFDSFSRVFKDIDCTVKYRASGVHSGGNPLIAYRLPEGYDIT